MWNTCYPLCQSSTLYSSSYLVQGGGYSEREGLVVKLFTPVNITQNTFLKVSFCIDTNLKSWLQKSTENVHYYWPEENI